MQKSHQQGTQVAEGRCAQIGAIPKLSSLLMHPQASLQTLECGLQDMHDHSWPLGRAAQPMGERRTKEVTQTVRPSPKEILAHRMYRLRQGHAHGIGDARQVDLGSRVRCRQRREHNAVVVTEVVLERGNAHSGCFR